MSRDTIQYRCVYQELVEPDALVPHPRNPKRHPELQIAALTAYIARAGWRHRVTVSLLSGRVVAGHARVEAAKRLGCLVPVEYQAFDDDAAELAHLLADNRLAELATVDTDMLGGDLLELEGRGWGGASLGFGDASPLPDSAGGDDLYGIIDAEPQLDKIAELQKMWNVKTGQLWQLGDFCVLHCCDFRDLKINCCNTLIWDPEWNVDFEIPSFSECISFCDGMRFGDMIKKCGPPTWVFTWDCVTSWFVPGQPLRRAKYAAYIGDIRKYNSEKCRVGEWKDSQKKDRVIRNTRGSYNYQADGTGPRLTDVFQRQITKEHSGELSHSHSKPLDWVRALIGNCTTGDVFDPFCGSGSSILACHDLKRKYTGAEIDPGYVAVTLQRYKEATGKEPILISGM